MYILNVTSEIFMSSRHLSSISVIPSLFQQTLLGKARCADPSWSQIELSFCISSCDGIRKICRCEPKKLKFYSNLPLRADLVLWFMLISIINLCKRTSWFGCAQNDSVVSRGYNIQRLYACPTSIYHQPNYVLGSDALFRYQAIKSVQQTFSWYLGRFAPFGGAS